MDESAVCFHTPETKQKSKQWLPKGTPGPVKARVHASRKKQMVFAFFDGAGAIYEHYAPLGAKVNANYMVSVLGKFLKILTRKRPNLTPETLLLHWDNAPVHTAAVTQEFLTKKGVKTLPHPPYSPDLAPADFWFFPTVKTALSGVSIDGQTVKHQWERAVKTLGAPAFNTAFRRWLERHEKCIRVEGDYVEKC